jgi:FKBP-type peptidyl-prolyl cis-trans isomerase 2
MIPAEVKEGDPVKAETAEGVVIVWVVKLEEETALVDANHPLAGRTLVFDVEVVSVEKGDQGSEGSGE